MSTGTLAYPLVAQYIAPSPRKPSRLHMHRRAPQTRWKAYVPSVLSPPSTVDSPDHHTAAAAVTLANYAPNLSPSFAPPVDLAAPPFDPLDKNLSEPPQRPDPMSNTPLNPSLFLPIRPTTSPLPITTAQLDPTSTPVPNPVPVQTRASAATPEPAAPTLTFASAHVRPRAPAHAPSPAHAPAAETAPSPLASSPTSTPTAAPVLQTGPPPTSKPQVTPAHVVQAKPSSTEPVETPSISEPSAPGASAALPAAALEAMAEATPPPSSAVPPAASSLSYRWRFSRMQSEIPPSKQYDLEEEPQSAFWAQPRSWTWRSATRKSSTRPTSPSHETPPTAAPPTPRKSRPWASALHHRATAFAAQLAQLRQPGPDPFVLTQTEFRRHFLKTSRNRIIRDRDGHSFRMLPIVMNGDCGFSAIAKGVNIARDFMSPTQPRDSGGRSSRWPLWLQQTMAPPAKRSLNAKDVRTTMFNEMRKAKKTYLADLGCFACVFSRSDLDRLERDVGRSGLAGHWLGTVLGILEHVIVAHALNINIYLYQFDLQKQCVRQFESAIVDNADCDVYLLFTGPASSGHFDALVKMPQDEPNSATNP